MSEIGSKIKALIQASSKRYGFDYCGVAKAGFLEEDAPRLENWLTQNYHGEMAYMTQHFDKRLDPRKLMDGCKTVVCFMKNYYPTYQQQEDLPKISKYAYGKDYHKVIKKDLQKILAEIQALAQIDGRIFVDSAPVLERSWAQKSGLGWIGKNGMLINKKAGSFYFIATMLLDIELEEDHAFTSDHCGSCTRCIDACPTDAILPDKTIAGNQCISYYTIELKSALIDRSSAWNEWVFGCDICQDVCPWNRFSTPHNELQFEPRKDILELSREEWMSMTEESFDVLSQSSPIRRTKLSGMKRNISFVKPKD